MQSLTQQATEYTRDNNFLAPEMTKRSTAISDRFVASPPLPARDAGGTVSDPTRQLDGRAADVILLFRYATLAEPCQILRDNLTNALLT